MSPIPLPGTSLQGRSDRHRASHGHRSGAVGGSLG